MIKDEGNYIAGGVRSSVETILQQMGFDVAHSRKSTDAWTIHRGSATIQIRYHEHSGFIISDVSMCSLPKENVSDIYTYLMHQNNILTGLSLSIYENNVLLSLILHDQSIQSNTMLKLFQRQLSIADKLDNILIEKFGANWND